MLFRLFGYLFGIGTVAFLLVAGGVAWYVSELTQDLPDYEVLNRYEPPVTTRIHAASGELMAEYAVLARDCGAKIIGGCCGTTPEHLLKMREALETRPNGSKPSLETIAEKLGGFSSDSDGTGDQPAARAPRGRRRRRA